jgi:hypothetical protein
MPVLHVDLQEGFLGDPVAISANGDARSLPSVRTRNQIGRADSLEWTLPDGEAHVTITVRNVTEDIRIPLQRDVYLGISVAPDGRILQRTSPDPFLYM